MKRWSGTCSHFRTIHQGFVFISNISVVSQGMIRGSWWRSGLFSWRVSVSECSLMWIWELMSSSDWFKIHSDTRLSSLKLDKTWLSYRRVSGLGRGVHSTEGHSHFLKFPHISGATSWPPVGPVTDCILLSSTEWELKVYFDMKTLSTGLLLISFKRQWEPFYLQPVRTLDAALRWCCGTNTPAEISSHWPAD